jgi:hypothetical protein
MAEITAKVRTQGMAALMNAHPGKKLRDELSLATRDQLAIIENNHKNKQIRRGGGAAVADRWTTRQGMARRSFHRDWKKGALEGAYGSDLDRMKKLEEGGTIRPKGTFLAIPTENAPKNVSARHVQGLVYIQSLKGQPMLVRPHGGESTSFDVMYILRRQVTLPPRPTLRAAEKATERARDKRVQLAIDNATGGE